MLRLDELGVIPAGYPRLQSGAPSADARQRQHLVHPMLGALDTRSKSLRFMVDYADKVIALSRAGWSHPSRGGGGHGGDGADVDEVASVAPVPGVDPADDAVRCAGGVDGLVVDRAGADRQPGR